MSVFTTSVQHSSESPSQSHLVKTKTKRQKKMGKNYLFANSMILYIKIPKDGPSPEHT
jgi:hypothetical protein